MAIPQKETNFIDLNALRAFWDVAFTIGTEAVNVINVAIQVQDFNGNPVTEPYHLGFHLSSTADGITKATAPSGGVAIGTDGELYVQEANLSFTLVSEDDGAVDIDITEVGATTFYLVARLPHGGLKISDAITFV